MPTINPTALAPGISDDRGDSVIACSIVFIVACTACLALRFVSHRIGRRSPNLEDWLMIPAWLLMMGLCTNVICSVRFGGVGRHEAYLLQYRPQAMTAWAQTLFVTELIYGIIMALEKTAILLLYLRVFQIHRWFRITTKVLIVFIWLWGISESLVAIFQCRPVAFQWNKKISGTCINQLAYYRWVRVPNAAHDIVMLVLPLPVIWKLRMATRQKVALVAVFLCGSIGCVASFISMAYFFHLNAFSDSTWASIQLMSWTLAEPGVVFICACLPALWPLVLVFLPRITTARTKSGNITGHYGNLELRSHSGDGSTYKNDDSVPLNNVQSMMVTNEVTGTHGASNGGPRKGGINVTNEFSWEEAQSVPQKRT